MDSEFKSFVYTVNELWRDNLLCDVTLVSGTSKIKAHKVILAGVSDYFKRMFCSEFAEANASVVELEFINPNILKEIVEWIYGREIKITFTNAFPLLNVASMLFLSGLEHLIRLYLEENMTVDNCLSCLQFARSSNNRQLEKYSLEMANEFYEKVVLTEEFLKLPDGIAYELQEEIKPSKQFVRVALAVGGYDNDSENQLRMPECLIEGDTRWTTQHPSFPNNEKEESLALLPAARWHSAYAGYNSSLFLFGGLTLLDMEPDNVTLEYSIIKNEWIYRTPIPLPALMNASATYMMEHDLIYVTGGALTQETFVSNKVFTYNPKSDKWREAASLLHARKGHCAVSVHGRLYILGGLNENSLALNSCERFDAILGRWMLCAPMHRARTSFACAALGRYIWVLGGYYYNAGTKFTLGWCERYDTIDDVWLDSVQLFPSRWGCIAAGPFGSRRPRRDLIIAGGSNEFKLRHDTVRFNTVSERPNPAPPMLYRRQDFAMSILVVPKERTIENL